MLSVHVNIMPWLIAVYSRYSLTWVIAKTYVSYRYITISKWVCVCVYSSSRSSSNNNNKNRRACVLRSQCVCVWAFTKGECVNTVDDGIAVRVCKVSSEKATKRTHSHRRSLSVFRAHTNTLEREPTDFQSSYHIFYIRFEIQSSSYHLLDRHEFQWLEFQQLFRFVFKSTKAKCSKRKSNFQHISIPV